MTSIERIRRANTGPEAWEPCIPSDGRPLGMAKWLHRRAAGGWSHTAMLWRCEPMRFDYDFAGDESFVVLSGRVRIELDGGEEAIELGPGDVASFPKATRSVWTVLETILKFTVISG